jgi:excisionase family DNA binding protein
VVLSIDELLRRLVREVVADEIRRALRDELPPQLQHAVEDVLARRHGPARAEFISPRRAAEILGLAPRTIWRLVASGSLPASRIGRRYRIRVEELDRFAARVMTTPDAMDLDADAKDILADVRARSSRRTR